jgi:hypothetical protein
MQHQGGQQAGPVGLLQVVEGTAASRHGRAAQFLQALATLPQGRGVEYDRV